MPEARFKATLRFFFLKTIVSKIIFMDPMTCNREGGDPAVDTAPPTGLVQ